LILLSRLQSPASAATAFKDSSVAPRYAPSRQVHVVHSAIEITPDFAKRSIRGQVRHVFTPINPHLRSIRLDSEQLDIASVGDANGAALTFHQDGRRLQIDLKRPAEPGETLSVTIAYSGVPRCGLYFNFPDAAHPRRPLQVFTQGETEETHFWVPCWDSPNDKGTSELTAYVPAGMTAVSNGRLVEHGRTPAGLERWHWFESVPHSSYLNSLVVGEFAAIEDSWNGIPLYSYVKPADLPRARENLGRLRDMVDFFSTRIGVPYPYEKYSQSFLSDFIFGGMENISATTNTDASLYDRRGQLDSRNDGLCAHELAHQWFGDLLTCRDWSQVWLNEGFATYFQELYYEHWLGEDEFTMELLAAADTYFGEDGARYRRPLVEHRYAHPQLMIDRHTYQKGAWVLHMLRREVGDSLFWKGIHEYVTRNRAGLVESDDLRRAFEDATGKSLQGFFQEWVYGAGYPEFEVSTEWKEAEHAYLIRVRQAQKRDELTPLFRLPLEFEVWEADGPHSYSVSMSHPEVSLVLPEREKPLNVRIDPNLSWLKKVRFEKKEKEWLFQLSHSKDAWGRIEALRGLAAVATSDSALEAVGHSLARDPFWGVRRTAAEALGTLRGRIARGALLASLKDPDAHVRRACLASLASFREDAGVRAALLARSRADSSYACVGEALYSYVRTGAPDAVAQAEKGLQMESFGEVIRQRSLEALGETGDVGALKVAESWSAPGHPDRLRATAVQVVGLLAQANRGDPALTPARQRAVRERLEGYLTDPWYQVRTNSAEALGKLGDPEAIPYLERVGLADLDYRVVDRTQRALEAIRRGSDSATDLKDLRRRVLEAEESERDMKRRLDEVESEVEHK
jgi:aminopeptidase N